MKAKITKTTFVKEYETKFGSMYLHKIEYDGKSAYFNSKSKEQDKFKVGEECEFTEEEKEGKSGKFTSIKPISNKGFSGFNKALKKEQSRYSGFAVSYAKDLCIAGKIEFSEISAYSTVLFDLMVSLDKTLEV